MPVTEKKIPVISDFVVLFFIGAILLIDFLPYFEATEIINPQFLYLSIINILMGVYFYFNQKSIVVEGISMLQKNLLTKMYVIFLLLCGLSVFAANNISLVITNLTEIVVVFLLFINLSILLKDKLGIFYKIVFIVGVAAFLQSWQELYNLMLTANRTTLLDGLHQMKGNTGSINILAASLTIKIPFLLLGITHFTGYKKGFLWFALLFAAASIMFTGARTALINVIIIFVIYIFYYLKTQSFKKGAFIKCLTLLMPVLIAVLITSFAFEKTNRNEKRYSSVNERIEQINTHDESIQYRLSMWENALILTEKKPILGVGLGNYRIESIPYESTRVDNLITFLHAHNDFLEIMAETGVINGLIYFSLFVLIFFINLKRVIKSNDEHIRVIALLVVLLVIIYGVDSLFNFPMYRPTMQIFLSLFFALSVINNPTLVNKKADFKAVSNLYPLVVVLSVITCYSEFLLYKASNLEYQIKSDDINKNTSGVLNGDAVINRLPLYPNVFDTSESYYEYAGIYYFREKKYDKAYKFFNRASKINPYSGRIDFYRHLISKERGDTDSAYVHIKKAFYRKPRNITFYEQSINIAASKRDTLEILKEHKLFTKYRNIPQAWKHAAFALQTAGYNRKKLFDFIDEGLKELPNDAILLRQKKDFMITDLIIEGQKYASEANPEKSLASYTKALKIDPENIYAMQNIGFHYYNQAQYKKAIGYFLNALKYPGLNDGHTEYYIALSYLQVNDRENGCKYFNLSKEKNYAAAQQQIDSNCK